MSGYSFELRRFETSGDERGRRRVAYWNGEVGRLGSVELLLPALEVVPVTDRSLHMGTMVTGDSVPVSSYVASPYGGKPRIAQGTLNVAGQHAVVSRNVWRWSKVGRALRIRAVGREYAYRETVNKRHHVLERQEAQVLMTRSSWKNSEIISGETRGSVDSVDVSLAILFEGVYTRNLSLWGAVVSTPGRFLDSLGAFW
ncbi:hypothetical protein GTW38_23710 [Streptomyces sp. SID7804]|uniref:Uncharacterized protein n=2 Tax=Streptomyces TaxID=1883 RepID=A0A514K100_9ACTN|nr:MULTISPECIES: hypothetical protein [Streptomyces]MBA8974045.1 hypothetical protein [Streptomyces calvus]MYS29868.1 hypothetical protein [Streptomyces sp. SID7804]QDI73311.1 hypothetical protein CD934_17875 [Streptomyces calvus]